MKISMSVLCFLLKDVLVENTHGRMQGGDNVPCSHLTSYGSREKSSLYQSYSFCKFEIAQSKIRLDNISCQF